MSARHLRWLIASSVAAVLVTTLAGCSSLSSAESHLPRAWTTVDGPVIQLVLLPDGTGAMLNFPLWDGVSTCDISAMDTYSGRVKWHGENGHPVINTPTGVINVTPDTRYFGALDWDNLVINPCNDDAFIELFGDPIDEEEAQKVVDEFANS